MEKGELSGGIKIRFNEVNGLLSGLVSPLDLARVVKDLPLAGTDFWNIKIRVEIGGVI